MSTQKSIYEKISETQTRLAQAKNRLKQLENTHRHAERKARAHRLIERGAMLESMIEGAATLSNEEIKGILTAALNTDAALDAILTAQSGAAEAVQGAGS